MIWVIAIAVLIVLLAALFVVTFLTEARRGVGFEQSMTWDGSVVRYLVKFNHPIPQFIGRIRGTPIKEFVWGSTIFCPGYVLHQSTHAHAFKHVLQNAEYDDFGGAEFELYYLRGLLCHGYGLRLWAEREAKAFGGANARKFDSLVFDGVKVVVSTARAA
jgi:hypothetical protein